jgi:hypothetical protein
MNFGSFISIFSFLKELVFGRNANNRRSSIPSRFRKWLVLILLIVSLSLNYFTVTKIFRLTSGYIALDKEKRKLAEEVKKNDQCFIALETVRDLLKSCINQ